MSISKSRGSYSPDPLPTTMVMNLWNDWNIAIIVLSQVQAAEIGLLRRVHGVTLRDKVRSYEILKALNIEPRLGKERSQLGWLGHVSKMSQELLARQVPLAQSSSTYQVSWLHLRPSLVPSSCVPSRTSWNCLKPQGIWQSPRAAVPTILSRG